LLLAGFPQKMHRFWGRDMNEETYSDAETERRANETLKRMLATPPKQHKDMKKGRRTAKR
jgi:hypothetical protein